MLCWPIRTGDHRFGHQLYLCEVFGLDISCIYVRSSAWISAESVGSLRIGHQLNLCEVFGLDISCIYVRSSVCTSAASVWGLWLGHQLHLCEVCLDRASFLKVSSARARRIQATPDQKHLRSCSLTTLLADNSHNGQKLVQAKVKTNRIMFQIWLSHEVCGNEWNGSCTSKAWTGDGRSCSKSDCLTRCAEMNGTEAVPARREQETDVPRSRPQSKQALDLALIHGDIFRKRRRPADPLAVKNKRRWTETCERWCPFLWCVSRYRVSARRRLWDARLWRQRGGPCRHRNYQERLLTDAGTDEGESKTRLDSFVRCLRSPRLDWFSISLSPLSLPPSLSLSLSLPLPPSSPLSLPPSLPLCLCLSLPRCLCLSLPLFLSPSPTHSLSLSLHHSLSLCFWSPKYTTSVDIKQKTKQKRASKT